jgi:hypothetical protein
MSGSPVAENEKTVGDHVWEKGKIAKVPEETGKAQVE